MTHPHAYGPMLGLATVSGPEIDYRLLSRYIGALHDECHTCQLRALDAIAEDPTTAGGFVAMVAAGVRGSLGPRTLEELRSGSLPQNGPAGVAAFAAMLADNPTIQYKPIFEASRSMDTEQRRNAVDFATGLFTVALATALDTKATVTKATVTKGFGHVEFTED